MPAAYHFHFRRNDPAIHGVIKQVGPYTLKPNRDRFGMLVRSIISQQISTSAARAIHTRLTTLVGPQGMDAKTIARVSIDKLRSVGLSPQKASYLHDLAAKVADDTVRLSRVGRMNDEEVITELTQVKGIGRWTAQMFLIFSLGREDVFPIDDLGVRMAIASLHGFAEIPPRNTLLEIGQQWSPYASIASWYCWRYLDISKKAAKKN